MMKPSASYRVSAVHARALRGDLPMMGGLLLLYAAEADQAKRAKAIPPMRRNHAKAHPYELVAKVHSVGMTMTKNSFAV